jgi:hypothetical protein
MSATLDCSRKKHKLPHLLIFAIVVFCLPASAQGQQSQTFTSGSTGADGALDYSILLPNGGTAVFDPAKFNPPLNPAGDNIFNFTHINIPANVTVRLSGRVLKGPVYWLASGDVIINGTINLNGEDGAPASAILDGRTRAMPGAGGFSGGVGGKVDRSSPSSIAASPVGQAGDGPGGGFGPPIANCNDENGGAGGSFTGNPFLVPLVGGSGAGGGNINASPGSLLQTAYAGGGGAGGGAILIASSSSINVNGTITANGGTGASLSGCFNASGGGGAGGGIRLLAPTLNGSGTLSALAGLGGGFNSNNRGANGAIRLEAFTDNFVGSLSGTAFTLGSPFSTFVPATGPPSIAIATINGVNVSQTPTGNLATPDASIDTTSPVQMTVQAKFIPPGTVVTLHVFSDNGTDQTVQTTPLQGTLQSSTATATVTFPSGFSLQFVKATWTQ